MEIISLKLENIKSYKNEYINFREGINCILGLNGSGKSTIIESIGYALFNYSFKTTNELLRYNENKGTVTIEFRGNDDKTYILSRVIRQSNNSIKLIDTETKQVLFENVADVYPFVKKIMNIPKSKSLPKLFEEIIAVPQGTFVSAFLETPRNRKETFDKLFDLDIYKDLASNMKDLKDITEKDKLEPLKLEKESLTTELKDFEELLQEIKKLENEITSYKLELDSLSKEKKTYEIQKQELDKIKQELDEQIKNNDSNKNLLKQKEDQLIDIQTNLDKANEANSLILTNEYGYKMYLSAQNKIKDLEEQLNKLKDLNYQYQDNNKNLEINNNSINHISNKLITEKQDLGQERQKEIDLNKSIQEMKQADIEYTQKLKELREEFQNESNKEIQIQYSFAEKKNELNGYKDELLGYEVIDTFDIQKRIDSIQKELNIISNYKNQIQEKRLQIIAKQKESEILEANKGYMNESICPILHTKCLNVTNSSFVDEINKKIDENTIFINNLTSEINEMTPLVNKEEELQKDTSTLAISKNNASSEQERFKETLETIKKKYNIDIDETNYLDQISILIYDLEKEIREYKNTYLESLNCQINEMNTSKASAIIHINIKEDALNNCKNKIFNLNESIEKDNLELIKLDTLNKKLEEENKKIVLKLDIYKNAEIELKEQKQVAMKFENAYNTYMENKKQSSELDTLKEKQKECLEAINNLKEQSIMFSNTINTLQEKYDEDLYKSLEEQIKTIDLKDSSIKGTLDVKQSNYDSLCKKKEYLKTRQEKLNITLQKIKKLTNIIEKFNIYRNVFINLPKELSEQIRNHISIIASSLYQKISNENVRLEITEDYEVLLIDMVDEKKVKSIKQLSGGEQMSVAIAVRLAMLKQITNLDIYFLDEPTINLDYDRRVHVGEVVKDISRELNQLFVISHDDTFDNITDHVINIIKQNNESTLKES